MKIHRALVTTVVLALIILIGCATTYKEGDQTVAGIQNVEKEARVIRAQVDATVAALNDMFNNQEGGLKMQFETYSKSIDDMEAQAKRLEKRVDAMKSKKAAYLQQWENQMATIQSEAVRQTAEQRRQSVEQMFTNVQREMDAAGEAFRSFMSKLNDIRTAMNMDLNRNGLNAMRPIADQARADAKVVNTRIDAAISELSQAAAALAATGG